MPAADPAHYVRGQYDGYREIAGVAPDSTTETYAAMRLDIDNWRWEGVPFYIRTGKHLPITQTELRLIFRRPPQLYFLARPVAAAGAGAARDQARPVDGGQVAGRGAARRLAEAAQQFSLDLEFAEQGGEGPTPYEVLLNAAMLGDSTRFTRQDSVEETWRVLQPLLDSSSEPHAYAKGSWGPEAAEKLVAHHGGWHGPWVGS